MWRVGVLLEAIPEFVHPAITELYMEMTANRLIYPMKPILNVGQVFFLLVKSPRSCQCHQHEEKLEKITVNYFF